MEIHIGRDGERFGPYDERRTEEMIRAGDLRPDDLAWRVGMADWRPLAELFPHAFPPDAAGTATDPASHDRDGSHDDAPDSRFAHRDAGLFSAPPPGILAEPAARLGATVLDGLIVVALPLLLGFAGAATDFPFAGPQDLDRIFYPFFLAGILFLALVILQIVLLSRDGQTVGKKIVGVRIVGPTDDRPAGFVRAVALRGFVHAFLVGIPGFGILYLLVDSLSIFRDDRRCLHDHIAGTRVIKA